MITSKFHSRKSANFLAVGVVPLIVFIIVLTFFLSGNLLDNLWYSISYIIAIIWVILAYDPTNYYNPIVTFFWYYLISVVLGGEEFIQSMFSLFSISQNARLMVILTLYAFLIGAKIVESLSRVKTEQVQNNQSKKVIPKTKNWILVAIISIVFGLLLSGFVFRNVLGFIPALVSGSESVRVSAKGGLGFLVMPIIISLQFGGLLLFTELTLLNKKHQTLIGIMIVVIVSVTLYGFGYRAPALVVPFLAFIIFSIIRYGRIRILTGIPIIISVFSLVGLLGLLRWGFRAETLDVIRVLESAIWRLNAVNFRNFDALYRFFPIYHDYLYGKSLWWDFMSLMPGADYNSGEFYKRILRMNFQGGGIVPTLPGELFTNFGWLGVFVGSFLTGSLLAYMRKYVDKLEYTSFSISFISLLNFRFALLSSGIIGGNLFLQTIPLVLYSLFISYLRRILLSAGGQTKA